MPEAIPWSVHQVWVQGGEESMPAHIRRLVASVRETVKMAGASYRMWSEADLLGSLSAVHPKLPAVYASAPNYACKSDILRLVALLTEGGIYLDTDMLVLQAEQLRWIIEPSSTSPALVIANMHMPTDDTLLTYNLTSGLRTNNCFLAAPPGSPIVRRLLHLIAETPPFDPASDDAMTWTMKHTGPRLFIRQVLEPLNGRADSPGWTASSGVRLVPKALVESASLSQGTLDLSAEQLVVTMRLKHPAAAIIHTEDRSWFASPLLALSMGAKSLSAFASSNATLLLILCVVLAVAVAVMVARRVRRAGRAAKGANRLGAAKV